jgi:hypothetical protein
LNKRYQILSVDFVDSLSLFKLIRLLIYLSIPNSDHIHSSGIKDSKNISTVCPEIHHSTLHF